MTKSDKNAKAKKAVKNDAVENAPSAYPIIGWTCWWTIFKTERPADELQSIVDATIGRNFMPDAPRMPKVVRNTLESIEKQGIITRIPNGDNNKVAYTLHKKEVDRVNVDLDLQKEQTIVYYKAEDRLEVKDEFHRQEIMDLIAKYANTFTEDDVRAVVLSYLKAVNAVTMRDSGGIYFVSDVDVRNRLRDFIVGNGGAFYAIGIPDTDTDKSVMHEIVKTELENDLQLASEELKKFLADSGDKKRIDALESRVERFKEIKAKAELYKDLLSNDIEDLQAQIAVVTDEVKAALSGEIEMYPQASDFPLRSRVVYSGKAKDKYGMNGTVVGYWTDSEKYNFGKYCRVLFDDCKKVVAIGVNTLKLAE